MLHAIEITLEAQSIGIGILVARACSRADRARRAGRERGVERGFAGLASLHAAPDESFRAGMCVTHELVVELVVQRVTQLVVGRVVDRHTRSVPTG
jgi:hypothetical protein